MFSVSACVRDLPNLTSFHSEFLELTLPIGDTLTIISGLALFDRVSIVAFVLYKYFLLAAQTGPTPFIHLLARIVAVKKCTQILRLVGRLAL